MINLPICLSSQVKLDQLSQTSKNNSFTSSTTTSASINKLKAPLNKKFNVVIMVSMNTCRTPLDQHINRLFYTTF